MPWIMCRQRSDHAERVGVADPAHHLRVAALVTRGTPPTHPGSPCAHATSTKGTSRAPRVAPHPVRVRVPGEVPDDAFASVHDVDERGAGRHARSRSGGRRDGWCRGPRPDGGRTRAPDRSSTRRGRRAMRPAPRAARRRRDRDRWCRAPRASRRQARPRRARPAIASVGSRHGVVVAAHVVHPRARARRNASRNASYSSGSPVSVRSPFTTTASGSIRAISATAARPITSG